ncbi:MAG: hypothetical protein JW910_03430, partial [Anaerolineae bacterium]|nr:hypothetical protein [Anaerolineae bacterium]
MAKRARRAVVPGRQGRITRTGRIAWIGVVFALLVLALGSGVILAQDDATPTPVINHVLFDDVYVRGGPGQGYVVVGQLTAGTYVRPASRSADGAWVLIHYSGGFGWVRRDLVFWADAIDTLPVLSTENLTPSPNPANFTVTPFFPTETPPGNWVTVGEQGGYVRAGPGRTYLALGAVYPGDTVIPIARTEDYNWVMIWFEGQPAWIAHNLVRWAEPLAFLPVIPTAEREDLTPSGDFLSTVAARLTATVSGSLTSTPRPSATATFTVTASATPSATLTATATDTATLTATVTLTDTPTSTDTPTDEPTATASDTPTDEPTATDTATDEPTATDTATDEPTATSTDTP